MIGELLVGGLHRPEGRKMFHRIGPLLLLTMIIVPTAILQAPVVDVGQRFGGAPVARASIPMAPRPPEQPAVGAGGAAVRYDAVDARRYGAPPTGYWLFTPIANGIDEPGTIVDREQRTMLPITIFFHGFTAVDPIVYREWIDHIVLRGGVVIYPDYQPVNPFGADWDTFLPNSLDAVHAALDRLTEESGASPTDLRTATVGHSLGGVLAVGYAAAAADQGLPRPAAVMAVEPGGCRDCGELPGGDGVPLPNLDEIDAATFAIIMVGDDDTVVGDDPAKKIWSELTSIPLDQRDYVTLRSDFHGLPPLRATHLQPQTARFGGRVDALDWYGTWKFFDLLVDCALSGVNCPDAVNDTEQQRFMGTWTDGQPVTTAWVTDHPGPPVHEKMGR